MVNQLMKLHNNTPWQNVMWYYIIDPVKCQYGPVKYYYDPVKYLAGPVKYLAGLVKFTMAQSNKETTWLVDLRGFESTDLLRGHNLWLPGRSATGPLPVDRNY